MRNVAQLLSVDAEACSKKVLLTLKEVSQDGNPKSLFDQLERSSVSISSNISEGIGRGAGMEELPRSTIHFFRIAWGSLVECLVQLRILKALRNNFKAEIHEAIQSVCSLGDKLAPLVGEKFDFFANLRSLAKAEWHWFSCACGGSGGIFVFPDETLILLGCNSCNPGTKVIPAPGASLESTQRAEKMSQVFLKLDATLNAATKLPNQDLSEKMF